MKYGAPASRRRDRAGQRRRFGGILTEQGTVGKIKITWVRSTINRNENHKRTVRALGLRRLNQSVVHEATPQVLGMIERVKYLVRVEEVPS